jgi:glycine betaine/proline transport system permease protein
MADPKPIIPQSPDDFPEAGPVIQDAANAAVEWLVVNLGDFFDGVTRVLLWPLVRIDQILLGAPPWLIIVIAATIALVATRSIVLTVFAGAAIWALGALGLWQPAMQTIALMAIAVGLAVLIGIPLGVLAARSNRLKALLSPVLDLMQTIPSFVYLIPAAMLFGLGRVPAILATVVYAVPPLIRLTDLGIREVEREVTEAARAFGATRWQMLRGVQFPLALPAVMQGINQTTMMALAMVVIASMIGARGIGETVLLGLQRNDPGLGLVGGIAIVLLAVLFDRVSQAFAGRYQTYRTVRSG